MLPGLADIDPLAQLDRQNVVWTTPSQNASGAMPIGNGELGLNVWVEEDGDLLFYLSRTDSWSEANRLLKLGRVRVRISPNPFAKGGRFKQELRLRDGRIEIQGEDLSLKLFVDAESPVVHVAASGKTPRNVSATLETWRTERRQLKGQELASSWTMQNAPESIQVWESADQFGSGTDSQVVWWHRNDSSVVPVTLTHQGLQSLGHLVKDPLLNRTFGGAMSGTPFHKQGPNQLSTRGPVAKWELAVATHTAQTETIGEWLGQLPKPVGFRTAERRTSRWWNGFWKRSYIFVEEKAILPQSPHPLRLGFDSGGGSRFAGSIANPVAIEEALDANQIAKLAATKPTSPATVAPPDISLEGGFTVAGWIKPNSNEKGRIFDKVTAGGSDGFLFDTHPGLALRFIVGQKTLTVPNCLKVGEWQHVAATVDGNLETRIYLNGKLLTSHKPGGVTQAYVLQRYVSACGGRGNYPIKFNGSIFTVDPKFTDGPDFNPDWRRWGDCFWWQNTRLPYFPMVSSGDFDQIRTLFRFYADVLPICKGRATLYHGVQGAYFPETMTIFGTYANNDYGWDRTGLQPKDVQCPYWQYSWQQGLELTALMLDYYEHTLDATFLKEELAPMALESLAYFDTRFGRDANGKLRITPTQAVETYWEGVVNDTPTVAGLIDVCSRLRPLSLPENLRVLVERLENALPALPVKQRRVAPAEEYVDQRSNVENPELYAIWPFRLLGVGKPNLDVARRTFLGRIEKASFGWQYDGQCAAQVGLADDAGKILLGKIQNSNPNHRFPAMWGPNYDWLPDQDHGANILSTLQTMLIQSNGDKIYVLPAWPSDWNVRFRLHAPKKTVVEVAYQNGDLVDLKVFPESRRKDVVLR